MHILSPVYASKLREKYSETLTRYKDPVINKFPAAGPSVPVNVPFIPLIQIIVKKYRKEDADFLHTSSTNKVMQEHDNFEKIEIEDILKPLADKQLRFVLITGEPGIGKSTLAKELTLRWVRKTDELLNNFKIVILILLRLETYQKAKVIEDLLIDVEDINMTEVMLSINETRGADVLWILDGFDELPHHLRSNSTSIFIQLIKGEILRKSTVIVTSRHAAIDPLLTFLEDDSKHIALRGFGSNEILEYASKYFKNEKVASEFRSYYSRNTMIESMLYNPMNCFIMCTVFNDFILTNNTKYPRTMTGIYNHYVRVLLKRHLIDAKLYHINDDMPQHLIREVDFNNPVLNDTWIDLYFLSKVAYEGVMTQVYIFGKELHGVPKLSMMDTISSFSGSFKDESSSFIHTTLQEYFAAIYLVNNPDSIFTNEDLEQNSNLEVVLTFYVGLLKFIDRAVDNKTMDMIFNHKGDVLDSRNHKRVSHMHVKNIYDYGEIMGPDVTPYTQLTSLMLRCMYEQNSLLYSPAFLNKRYVFSNFMNPKLQFSYNLFSEHTIMDYECFICGYIVAAHNITLKIEPYHLSEIIAFNKGLQSHSSVNGKIIITLYNASIWQGFNSMISGVLDLPSDMVVGLHLVSVKDVWTCYDIISKFLSLQEITLRSTTSMIKLPLLNLKKLKQLNIRSEMAAVDFELLKKLTAPGRLLKQLHVFIMGAVNTQILNLIERQSSLEELRIEVSALTSLLKIIWCNKNNSLTVSDDELLAVLYAKHIGVSKIQLSSFTLFCMMNNEYYAITIYSEPVPSNLSDFIEAFNTNISHILNSKILHQTIQLNKFMYGTILPTHDYRFFIKREVKQCKKRYSKTHLGHSIHVESYRELYNVY